MTRALFIAVGLLSVASASAERLRFSVSDERNVLHSWHELAVPTTRGATGTLSLLRSPGSRTEPRRIVVPERWAAPLWTSLRALDAALGEERDRLMVIPPDPDPYERSERLRRLVAQRDVFPGQVDVFDGHMHLRVRNGVMTGLDAMTITRCGRAEPVPIRLRANGEPILPEFLDETSAFPAGSEDFLLLTGRSFTQLIVMSYDRDRDEVVAIYAEDFWQRFLLPPGRRRQVDSIAAFRVPAVGLYRWTERDQQAAFDNAGRFYPFARNRRPETWQTQYPQFTEEPVMLDYRSAVYNEQQLGLFTYAGLLRRVRHDCAAALSHNVN